MALLNNFSPLPWYKSVAEQDFRKWWKYGHIYDLFSDYERIIPSQIVREGHSTGPRYGVPFTPRSTNDGQWLRADGQAENIPGEPSATQVFRIGSDPTDIPSGIALAFRSPKPYEYNGVTGQGWIITDANYATLAYGTDSSLDLADYPTAKWMWVEVANPQITERVFALAGTGVEIPDVCELYTKEGVFVADIFDPAMFDGKAIASPFVDVLYTPIGATFPLMLDEGRYYIHLADSINEWYSDVFTVVKDTTPFLRLAWWDDNDFVMDAGVIAYEQSGSVVYNNVLLLRADIAKPTYDFEDEGETRDGIFYPTKQISKKKYAMHILANEPMLDVLRLVRMADHIDIGYHTGGVYFQLAPTTFLITPEWESEGDLAGVSIEFETDTIAKKIGLAYIRG